MPNSSEVPNSPEVSTKLEVSDSLGAPDSPEVPDSLEVSVEFAPRGSIRSLFARGCWPGQHTRANRIHTPAIRPTYTGESYIHRRIDLWAGSTVHV